MRVLLFIESGGPGGAEQAVVALAEALRSRDIELIVCTLRTGWLTETLDSLKIKRHLLPTREGRDLLLAWRLAKFLSKEDISILHSHLLDSNFYGAIASKLSGIPHLATEHGDIHHTKKKSFLDLKLKIISWCGSTLSAVSRYSAKALAEHGIKPAFLKVIPNILMESPHSPETRFAMRKELGIEEGTWAWAHVANMRPVKDQKTLLRAFAISCSQTDRSQTLLLVGDGPERKNLEELAEELGVEERLQFLGFREDVGNILQAADGFLLSSKSEALPMSVLEAAQAELLLIATDVGGMRDIISPAENGYLCSAGDPEGMAELMTGALNDQATSRQLGRSAAHFVKEAFSLESVVEQYITAYQNLLGEKTSP